MPKYHIERTVHIAQPTQTVMPLICDFRNWPTWSPWLCQEPEADVQYFGSQGTVGASYSWSGTRVGAGSMSMTAISDTRLEFDLNFIKSFKSRAKVALNIQAHGSSACDVVWEMNGSLPFFLFFMLEKIKFYVGMDYERGLRMLKELAEQGSVASQVSLHGITLLPETDFLSHKVTISLKEAPEVMEKHYSAMFAAIEGSSLEQSGPPFSNNLRVNMPADRHEMILGIPVNYTELSGAGGYTISHRPAYTCAQVRHIGAYEHLGNAWACAMSWLRHEKIKAHKESVGIELYVSDPRHTDRAELQTDLYLPIYAK